jgi:hypothetical protein
MIGERNDFSLLIFLRREEEEEEEVFLFDVDINRM